VLGGLEAPTIYDKLLPVPLLNLSVRWLDRIAGVGILGALGRFEARFAPARLNAAYMGIWAVLFLVMASTGFVEGFTGPHPGRSVAFWQDAIRKGNPYAGAGLVDVLKGLARDGSSPAMNELGVLAMQGAVVPRDPAAAARYFAKASAMGNLVGSTNLVLQFVTTESIRPGKSVDFALDQLERACAKGADGVVYHALACAYDGGKGRPLDKERARALFKEACSRGYADACQALSHAP
ncbi:MAG TPA: hypothetical protein VKE69_01740, partial [Planctomycetota bacterium]|nr:hypothetical protein [Planctomycetota bacterium]